MRNFIMAATITLSAAVVPASVQAADKEAAFTGSFASSSLTFTLDKSVTSFDATVNSTYTKNNGGNYTGNGFDIDKFSLVNTATNQAYLGTVVSGYPKITTIKNSTNYSESFTLKDLSLAAGNYAFVVTGTKVGTGTYNGTYDYNYKIASSVPEPSTYAMLLAGLALVGITTYRKNKQGTAKPSSFVPNFGNQLVAA